MVSFRFCLCGAYLSVRDAFKVSQCGVPADLASVSNGALGHLWAQSRCSWAAGMAECCRAGMGPVQSTQGSWASAPSTDWSQRPSRGSGSVPASPLLLLCTEHSYRIQAPGIPPGDSSPKCLQLAQCSKESESFPGILSPSALNSLWSPA